MKKKIIIFYGSHNDENFDELKEPLEKEVKELQKNTKNIFLVIENGGIYKSQFEDYKNSFPNISENKLYDLFSSMMEENIFSYKERKVESICKEIEGEKIEIFLSKFYKRLVDFASKYELEIIVEKPRYKDFLKTYDYEPPTAKFVFLRCRGSPRKILKKWQKKAKSREKSFIKQIKKTAKANPNHSFIIVRGSLHKVFYKKIRRVFENEFEVKKIEYGKQIEEELADLW